jgi:endonuclease/exonuclease/phosphatase family metal-dependent hydrolase
LDNRKLSFLNVYGPCQDHKVFWEALDGSGLLSHKDLILAGDLNFTTSPAEVWGKSSLLDTLAGFFKSLFQMNGLVDVAPVEKVPTWRNDREGDACITKRLDRFYLDEALLSTIQRFRTWVEYPYLSDHAPALLEFGIGFSTVASPFKLNLIG